MVRAVVLQGGDRFDQLPAGPEVVKRSAFERHDSRTQRCDTLIFVRGIDSERGAELAVKFIGPDGAPAECFFPGIPSAALEQQLDGAPSEQPDPGVDGENAFRGLFANLFRARLLQEKVDFTGRGPLGKEHTELAGGLGRDPHAERKKVGAGKVRKAPRKIKQHVAAADHQRVVFSGSRHDAVELGPHVIEQCPVDALSAAPSHDGKGNENLARGGVGRKPAALTSGEDRRLRRVQEPVAE